MKNLFMLITFFLSIVVISDGQENVKTVTATGEHYIEGISPEAAYDLAVEDALIEAKRFLGIQVSSFQLLVSELGDEAYYQHIKTETRGKILDYEIIKKEKISDPATNSDKWQVTVKATVAEDYVGRGFDLTAELDKRHYNDEEEIKLIVKSSKDCYLYIFHIFEIHEAVVWLPDEKFFQPNFLKANQTRTIPAKNETPIQLSITPDHTLEIDHILIVATDKDIGFTQAERVERNQYHETTLFQINKWLLDWDRDVKKTEIYLPFVIHKQ